jgi:hypothetical protein
MYPIFLARPRPAVYTPIRSTVSKGWGYAARPTTERASMSEELSRAECRQLSRSEIFATFRIPPISLGVPVVGRVLLDSRGWPQAPALAPSKDGLSPSASP